MRHLIVIAAILLGATACKQAPPVAPIDNSAAPTGEEEPWATVNRLTQEAGVPTQSVTLEDGGRAVKRDSVDAYEEEFFVRDIIGAEYVFHADWTQPHTAELLIDPAAPVRFRYGGGAWSDSTIPHISFVFTTAEAAEEAVRALQTVVR